MKPPIEKPSESGMRFFTPELYVRFNSSHEDEADRASEAWEKNLQEYQHHLDALKGRMPSKIRKLAGLCLHDWELLAFHEEVEPCSSLDGQTLTPRPIWSAVAVLSLRQDDHAIVLVYLLWDRVRERPSVQPWPFSKKRKHWLYDEIDEVPEQRGLFLQRVLFSDGEVLEIPIASCFIQTFPLPIADKTGKSRKTA